MDILIPRHQRVRYENLDYDAIENANYALMQAYAALKRETCPKCGTPYWIGHNPDSYIQFTVEEETCHACAEVGAHEAKKKGTDHGVVTYPVVTMLFDHPVPSREEGYLRMRGKDG